MATVTLFGGMCASDPADLTLAHEIGRAIGEVGATLQHGDCGGGLIEEAARGATIAGGRVLAAALADMMAMEHNPHWIDAIRLPRFDDRLHRLLDSSDLVIAMSGGIDVLYQLTGALWYSGNIRHVPVWVAGTEATRLLDFLRREQQLHPTRTCYPELLREIIDITHFRRRLARLFSSECATAESLGLPERIRVGALRRGRHQLASGDVLNEYFDQYALSADPTLLRDITSAILTLLPADTEVLAGLALGGVPLASAAALTAGLPLACVRRAPKTYGTGRTIEGPDTLGGKRVTLVDDITRTGSQMLDAAIALRGLGAEVAAAVCVIDRALEARKVLGESEIQLHAVMTQPATTSG